MRGEPIRIWGIRSKLDTQIDIDNLNPGLVPLYECLEACRFSGYTWYEWEEQLDSEQRAIAIAHYRMHNLIETHVQQELERQRGNPNRSRANRR